jgi:hypothetical protein
MNKSIKKNKMQLSLFFKKWTKNTGAAPSFELINIRFSSNKIEGDDNSVPTVLKKEYTKEWDFSDISYDSGIRYYQKTT